MKDSNSVKPINKMDSQYDRQTLSNIQVFSISVLYCIGNICEKSTV